jgi:hypothetical protein
MLFVGIGTYKGNFMGGNLDGWGHFDYFDGSSYEGNWKENKKSGLGKYIEAGGLTVYEGEWLNDEKEGKGTFL